MDYDLQVYDFGQLEETDLGGLLDEGLDEFNDDTFGAMDDGPVGRDFDFSGNTSKLLGGAGPGRELQSAGSSWLTPAAAPAPAAAPSSAWSSLDADPLLARGPVRAAAAAAVPARSSPAPPRGMKTLDEIEAEMRAQAQQRAQQQPPQPQQQPPAGRPLTLEEVEADMLRRARSQASQPSAPSPSNAPSQGPPQHPQQPQQQQQFGQPPFPPQSRSPFPPPQYGMPQMGRPGPPFPPQGGMPFPPQQFQQGHGRPGSMGPFPPGMFPMPHPGQTASPLNGAGPRPPTNPNMPSSQLLPLPGAPGPDVSSGVNLMNTLFPPLPSQATPASLEQQLQYLTMNQHAQHPSLTAAQLHSLLQNAQMQQAKFEAAANAGGEGESEEKEMDKERKEAGEKLIQSVEQRIREHEEIEKKRKLKAQKIASMAKHNNLMSNSDKDFITRIQVSQLVTDDPYADDFYFHIMAAIKQSRSGPPPGTRPGGPNAPRPNPRNRNIRRENAMSRMAQNVQRLVDSAKQRNKSGQLSVDGALGKIALRTRSAPRQLLQVAPPTSSSPAPPSAGHSLLSGLNAQSSGTGAALSYRAVLAIIEEIYDIVLDLEQMKRGQPAIVGRAAAAREHLASLDEEAASVENPQITAAFEAEKEWEPRYAELTAKLWTALRVMEPLDQTTIHPFVSLLTVLKGKRILGRAIRHLSPEQTLTLITLIVATFDTLDTVVDAPLLDATDDVKKVSSGSLESKQKRAAVEAQTEAFLNAIIGPFMTTVATAPLRMVTGMLGLLMERNNFNKVVHAKPGIAFLTILLNRAESLKQAEPAPEAADLSLWEQTFNKLFNALSTDLLALFPSTRAVSALPFGSGYYLSGQAVSSVNASRPDIDLDDEPVWRFLASVAVCSSPEQQQHLVLGVKEKVLENVSQAKKGRVTPEVAALKIRNADLLLHSLGLDSSQLTIDE